MLRDGPVLGDAEDGADGEESCRGIEGVERIEEVGVAQAGAETPAVEGDGQEDEEREDSQLQDKSGLEEVTAEILLAGGEGLVGGVGYAVAVEDFDHKGNESEGADDTTGMNGGVVRGVVEDAAEDVVVGKFEEGTGAVLVGTRSTQRRTRALTVQHKSNKY